MKRIVILLTALALVATGCNKGQKFTLTGDLEKARFDAATDSLLLQSDAFPTVLTIPVRNGAFSYSGRLEQPALATLKAPGVKVANKLIIVEKGTITFENGYPRGTPLNEAFYELDQQVRETVRVNRTSPQAIPEAMFKLFHDYLSQHADDPTAVLAIVTARRFLKPDQMAELIAMTPKSIQRDSHISKILIEIELYQNRKKSE